MNNCVLLTARAAGPDRNKSFTSYTKYVYRNDLYTCRSHQIFFFFLVNISNLGSNLPDFELIDNLIGKSSRVFITIKLLLKLTIRYGQLLTHPEGFILWPRISFPFGQNKAYCSALANFRPFLVLTSKLCTF